MSFCWYRPGKKSHKNPLWKWMFLFFPVKLSQTLTDIEVLKPSCHLKCWSLIQCQYKTLDNELQIVDILNPEKHTVFNLGICIFSEWNDCLRHSDKWRIELLVHNCHDNKETRRMQSFTFNFSRFDNGYVQIRKR